MSAETTVVAIELPHLLAVISFMSVMIVGLGKWALKREMTHFDILKEDVDEIKSQYVSRHELNQVVREIKDGNSETHRRIDNLMFILKKETN